MNNGKELCSHLKAVRRDIAEQNDIPLVQEECKHEGDCAGTCPRCEQEVRYLERELLRRKSLGKAATIVGIAAGIAGSIALTSCRTQGEPAVQGMPPYEEVEVLMGDPMPQDPDSTLINQQ